MSLAYRKSSIRSRNASENKKQLAPRSKRSAASRSLSDALLDGELVLSGNFYGGVLNPNVQDEERACVYDFKGRQTGEPIYSPAWSGEGFVTILADDCRGENAVFIQVDELLSCISVPNIPEFDWERSVGVGSLTPANLINGITDEGLEIEIEQQSGLESYLISVKGRRNDENFGDIIVYTAGLFVISSAEVRNEALDCDNGGSGDDCQCGIPPPFPPNDPAKK